jgi:hypothetical protein
MASATSTALLNGRAMPRARKHREPNAEQQCAAQHAIDHLVAAA